MRRLARGWLLWLALLLPIAQAMADVHALSHLGDSTQDSLTHREACDLCLTAAQLAGGGPVAEPAPLPACTATAQLAPASCWQAVVCEALWRPPARAPPVSA